MNTSQDSERANGAIPASPRRRLWRTSEERAADKAAALVRKERALIEAQRARDQRDVERIEAKQEKRRLHAKARGDRQTKKQDSAKRPIEDVLTVVAASIATGVSAQGMWRFSGDVLGLDGPLRLLLFAFIEVAIITSAVRARRNMRENFSAGIDGIAVWALTCLTAVLSSMDARSLPEAVFRLAAPLVAAWLWERGMAIERHRIRGTGRINWRLTPERLLVRVGLAEVSDRTASEVDAHRRLTRVALAAKQAKALRENGASERKLRRALAKLDRRMDQVVEHTGLPRDKKMQWALLDQVTTLRGGTSLMDLPDVAPWADLDHPALTGARHSEANALAEETRRLTDAVLSERDPEAAAMIEMLAAMLTGRRVSPPGSATNDQVSPTVADLVAGRVSLRAVSPPDAGPSIATVNATGSATSDQVADKVAEEVADADDDEDADDTETASASATEAMWRHWQKVIEEEDRVPSGAELARVAGCRESYARRKRNDWIEEMDGRVRRRLIGPKKVTA